jgi:hypothetical protein
MPDPVLRTTLVETHPRLAFYLHKCHEFFGAREIVVVSAGNGGGGFGGMFEGWGVQKGKRTEDLIGIGCFIGGVFGYALWNSWRR